MKPFTRADNKFLKAMRVTADEPPREMTDAGLDRLGTALGFPPPDYRENCYKSEISSLAVKLAQGEYREAILQERVDTLAAQRDRWRRRFTWAVLIPAVVVLTGFLGWVIS